jgi:predicted amidohydrolase
LSTEQQPSGKTITKYTAAVVQHPPIFLNREASTDLAVALIEKAAGNGAALVAFPETWIPGYPEWIFGALGWEDEPAKLAHARLRRNSVAVPSACTDRLCAAAREVGVTVVVGINEIDTAYSRGTMYNSQLFISESGEILGVRRKLVPTHAERVLWGQGDGSDLAVWSTRLGRLGGLVCWEHWMPLARFALHALGEQVHIASWPEGGELHHLVSRTYAFEGRCFVLYAGGALRSADIPDDLEVRERWLRGYDEIILPGGSGIIGPDGSWISGPVDEEQDIVYGVIDLDAIDPEFQSLDTAGHYNRPDIFHLEIDTTRRRPIHLRSPETTPELNESQVGTPTVTTS